MFQHSPALFLKISKWDVLPQRKRVPPNRREILFISISAVKPFSLNTPVF